MKTEMKTVILVAILSLCASSGNAADETADPSKKDLSAFLVDVTSGQVSAAGLVGVSDTLVTNIQTSQDWVVAAKPFMSGSSKNGFGIALTPARTNFLPMSGKTYRASGFNRFVAAITLSYAESHADISGVTFNKRGASVDSYIYFDPGDDPILAAYSAFTNCSAADEIFTKIGEAAAKNDAAQIKELQPKWDAANAACIEGKLKKEAKWNTGKLQISVGRAQISKPGGDNMSLGTTYAINVIQPIGDLGAAYLALNKVQNQVDLKTVATIPKFHSSSLAAIRLTRGINDAADQQVLVEISNASKDSATVAFKYAVGVDFKVGDGAWLEFRLGRSRTATDSGLENKGTLSLNISPTCMLSAKCKKSS